MFILYSINLAIMRNPQLIDRLSRTLSAPKRCSVCSKMVYFKTIRCKKCRYVMHTSCYNSSNHFCQNEEIYGNKSDSNNSLFNNLNTPNSSQDISTSQKNSAENLDYWRYFSSNESNDLLPSNLTDNLVYDELPVFSNAPKSADYNQIPKNHHQNAKQQRNSFDGTMASKFSFNFINDTPSSKSTPTTPFKIVHDKNNNNTITVLNEEENSFSTKCNQIKMNLVGSNSKLTSCIKNWFHTKTGRRNSKESLTKANLADKPVRSKYSLTIDEKITKKQLENLIKKNKKANKVRFNEQQLANNQFKLIPQHKPLTPRAHNVEQFLFEQQRLIESQRQAQFGNMPSNSNMISYVQTHIISSSPVHQQQFTYNKTNHSNQIDSKPMSKLEKKLMEVKKELLESKPLLDKNTRNLTQKDSLGVEHYYCPSKVGYQKRHIPKLFRNNQNVQFPDKLGDDLLKAEKQILTKARTLSMEAKTDVCQSFFATWPTTSVIVGKIEDLTATEEEINRSLISSYENNLNEDIEELIKEWSVPSKDIRFDKLLRQSSKGEIYKGKWHGDVLIYTFNKTYTTDEDLAQFKKEIAQLTKIRHDNIMLFMGCCIEPNNLAVITNTQKGSSVYETIHKKQQNLPFATKLNILRQVAQAMGYLHARGIVHKKISSNNIILENNVKICLMDQGFNTYDYNSENYAIAAKGHLTYLSPELIRSLYIEQTPNYSIFQDYSKESDVYAFGTLIFEILSNKYPYQKLQTDQIIWKIGNGFHDSVEQLKCDSILKSLLSQCWAPDAEQRPAFSLIVKKLQENVSLNKRHSSSEPESLNKIGLSRHL